MKLYRYQDEPFQPQGPGKGYKAQHTDSMSLVTWRMDKGVVGEMHSHPQEQIAYVLQGAMEFHTEKGTVIARAGDQVLFAGNEAHGSLALEDSVILDIFSSVREDFKGKLVTFQPEDAD